MPATPVAAMCATAGSAAAPPTTTSPAMSAYQKIPSPSRLTARKSARTQAMLAAWLQRMHQASSQPASTCSGASKRRTVRLPLSESAGGAAAARRCDVARARALDHFAEYRLEVVDDAVPRQAFGGPPGRGSQPLAQVPVGRELHRRGDERRRFPERGEQPVRAIADVLARRTVIEGDDC